MLLEMSMHKYFRSMQAHVKAERAHDRRVKRGKRQPRCFFCSQGIGNKKEIHGTIQRSTSIGYANNGGRRRPAETFLGKYCRVKVV